MVNVVFPRSSWLGAGRCPEGFWLRKTKDDTTTVPKSRSMEQRRKKKVISCKIYCDGLVKEHKYVVGFVVGENMPPRPQVFSCGWTSTRNSSTYRRFAPSPRQKRSTKYKEPCSRHDIKIVLGDFNAKFGKKYILAKQSEGVKSESRFYLDFPTDAK